MHSTCGKGTSYQCLACKFGHFRISDTPPWRRCRVHPSWMTTTALYSAVFTPDGRGLTLRLQLAACGTVIGMHKLGEAVPAHVAQALKWAAESSSAAPLIIWLSGMAVMILKHG